MCPLSLSLFPGSLPPHSLSLGRSPALRAAERGEEEIYFPKTVNGQPLAGYHSLVLRKISWDLVLTSQPQLSLPIIL
jgi:hypothetical protein